MAFDQVRVRYPNGQEYGPYPFGQAAAWAAGGQIPMDSIFVDAGTGEARVAKDFPEVMAQWKPTMLQRLLPGNAWSVLGYYIGVFSFVGILLCVIPGLLGGFAAIGLGLMGIRESERLPGRAGRTHGIVAIVCGAVCVLICLGLIAAVIAAR